MTPDSRNYFGQQEVNLGQLLSFAPYQFGHGSSGGISSPVSLGEEMLESQSTNESFSVYY